MQYTCASCEKLCCCDEAQKDMPKNCPMHQADILGNSLSVYEGAEIKKFSKISALVESEGYCEWHRVREIIEFSNKMGYHRLGLAFCKGLQKEARAFEKIMRSEGFEVNSVICKTGGVPKEDVLGITESEKVRPGSYEPMCNPVAQAYYLNSKKTDFNVVIGLCVGHDSLFYKYSDAMVTTLVIKDRVLAHNPAGALYCAESYYRNK